MSRKTVKHVVNTPQMYYDEYYKCDKCGRDLNREDNTGDDFPNELRIYLNPDECVHQQFRRDYCTDCLKPIWDAICAAISADPDDLAQIDEGDHD